MLKTVNSWVTQQNARGRVFTERHVFAPTSQAKDLYCRWERYSKEGRGRRGWEKWIERKDNLIPDKRFLCGNAALTTTTTFYVESVKQRWIFKYDRVRLFMQQILIASLCGSKRTKWKLFLRMQWYSKRYEIGGAKTFFFFK